MGFDDPGRRTPCFTEWTTLLGWNPEEIALLADGGGPADVAGRMVSWLATSDADYVTGQVLEIHGGLEMVRIG
jgi:NAD(P)-dependent dehydrogenase (short-subunit alcohol dehydrogenase family)